MQVVARLFVPTLIAFLVGVGFAAFVVTSQIFIALLCVISLTCLVAAMFQGKHQRLFLIGVCLIAAALGMLRFLFWAEIPNDPVLELFVEKTVVLRGVITDEPDVREKNTQLTFSAHEAGSGDELVRTEGKVLLIVDRYPIYHYGDQIEIRGVLKHPEVFSGDDGRVFDYPDYLKARGISYQMFRPNITVRGFNQGNIIRAKLFTAKRSFLLHLARVLPEPENALAGGILLGEKRSLGEEWTERFRTTGVIHIVVLSGYNMTIVAEWLGAAFLFLGFYGSLAVSALGIICFALMTGAGATVVRAAIMAILVLLARLTGRTSTMGRALLVAGTLMVLHNPAIIAFDPSFQLSFLAALGLIFVAPLIRARMRILKKHPVLEEVVVSTIATQITVLPLLLYQTGIFSIIALPANLLVLPTIPIAMLLAFITGTLAFSGNIFAFVPALFTHALLAFVLAVGKYGAAFPFAAVHVPYISGWFVFLAYAVLALLTHRYSRPTLSQILPQAR